MGLWFLFQGNSISSNHANKRFGLEGLVNIRDLAKVELPTEFLAEEYAIRIGKSETRIAAFDKVVVSVEAVREESTGKQKVKMLLVQPEVK
jgi:S1 domain